MLVSSVVLQRKLEIEKKLGNYNESVRNQEQSTSNTSRPKFCDSETNGCSLVDREDDSNNDLIEEDERDSFDISPNGSTIYTSSLSLQNQLFSEQKYKTKENYFRNLTHLDISGNSAEKLDLRNLSRLEWLCCSHNQLEILILSGSSLTYLDCSHNHLESIVVDPLPNNLVTLQLSFNNLDELPSWIWMIPELFILYASHNRLHHVDCRAQNSLSHLPIRELHLHCNRIEFLSKDFILRATRLKVLNLSQNVLETLPAFGKKSQLQELYISRNHLQDTEEMEGLEFLCNCTSLRKLNVAYNQLEKLNDKFINVWKNLEELIICGNKLVMLPQKISSLSKLRVLRVHSNKLETVPSFTKMPMLKLLDLSHNNLKKINLENIMSSGSLTYLDISCNDRLAVNPEKIITPRRPMNLVEVTNPRKKFVIDPSSKKSQDFPANPPWELGFSELPNPNQILNATQYRDINLCNGREALFGLFDAGSKGTVSKSITKSITKLYSEERSIEKNLQLSLKYTLLNTLRALQNPIEESRIHGILGLLSMHEDSLLREKPSFILHLASVGGIRSLLIEADGKATRLTDSNNLSQLTPNFNKDDADPILNTEFNNEGDLSISVESDGKLNNDLSGNLCKDSIPDPSIITVRLTTSTEFLLIANQNLWNHVNEQEILDELEEHRTKKSVLIAKRLTDLAQSHSCKESLSVLLIRFKWRSTKPKTLVLDSKKLAILSEYGPLSYNSGSTSSSDYSEDVTNPLASVVTPDSAIDTDRSSVVGSFGSGTESKTSHRSINDSNSVRNTCRAATTDDIGDDSHSLANTTMSVEQLRCWEYMLEQNTRLLFKKELDSISKGMFQRNGKQRKSISFPYTPKFETAFETTTSKSNISSEISKPPLPSSINSKNTTNSDGFSTVGKAKSLSHLLASEQNSSGRIKPKSYFPLFTNANAGFLESVRSAKATASSSTSNVGTILGGPNAAYFSSSQRQHDSIPMQSTISSQQGFRSNNGLSKCHPRFQSTSSDEIQEIQCHDQTRERENRLKKYWDNKITEL